MFEPTPNDIQNKIPPIPNIEQKDFFNTLNSVVTKRFLKPYDNNQPITYEVTSDIGLLHQYFNLRNKMYYKTFKVENHNWDEDKYDKLSFIIVARRGRLCVGGCRLIIREPDEQWLLPMEDDNFKLRELFPDLKLDQVRHAEISRFAVMEDVGKEDILHGMYNTLYDLITTSNISYVFVKSLYHTARKWRLVSNSFGVKTTKILDDIHPANDLTDDIKWCLTMSDLSSFCKDQDNNVVKENASSDKIKEPG